MGDFVEGFGVVKHGNISQKFSIIRIEMFYASLGL